MLRVVRLEPAAELNLILRVVQKGPAAYLMLRVVRLEPAAELNLILRVVQKGPAAYLMLRVVRLKPAAELSQYRELYRKNKPCDEVERGTGNLLVVLMPRVKQEGLAAVLGVLALTEKYLKVTD